MDTKEKIMEAAIVVFQKKGLKFTMDDLAAELSMSKKTIYKEFKDKGQLFLEIVDYCFDKIKESEREVMEDVSLSAPEKLKKILGVLPESYLQIDFSALYPLKDKYPQVYRQIERRLETGWESTFALLEQGMSERWLRPVNISIFKSMMEASLERFFVNDFLESNHISYQEALDEVVSILLNGILMREGE